VDTVPLRLQYRWRYCLTKHKGLDAESIPRTRTRTHTRMQTYLFRIESTYAHRHLISFAAVGSRSTSISLGLIDPPSERTNPFRDLAHYGPAQVDTPESRALALSAAEQSMTLLKNDGCVRKPQL
jgi:beta-glucosidase-like glycosyl hydrolase